MRQDQLAIIVEDHGCGFDSRALEDPKASLSGGLGLTGMQERLATIGGELEVDSEPGWGTRVTVRVSIDQGRPGGTGQRRMAFSNETDRDES